MDYTGPIFFKPVTVVIFYRLYKMSGCVAPLFVSGVAPIFEECSGYGLSKGQTLFDYWSDGKCYSAMYSALYGGATIGLDSSGLAYSRCIMDKTFRRYLFTNNITEPGQGGYNSFQETLLETCRKLPGVCDTALINRVCDNPKGLDVDTLRAEIAGNRTRLNFCGCFAPSPSDVRLQLSNSACDPLCARITTVPRMVTMGPLAGTADLCNQDICVINDVSITATKSVVQGGVSFGQVCNNCSTGNCTCVISGVNISGILSDLGVPNMFSSICGSGSTCLQGDPLNPTAPPTLVPCESVVNINTANIVADYDTQSRPTLTFYLILGTILLFFLLVLGVAMAGKLKQSYVYTAPYVGARQ